MEKALKDTKEKKAQTDDPLEAFCGLFAMTLVLALIWLMERFF